LRNVFTSFVIFSFTFFVQLTMMMTEYKKGSKLITGQRCAAAPWAA
jgi:hypothetical protein